MEQGKINITFTHPNEAATKGAAVGASKRGVKMRGGSSKVVESQNGDEIVNKNAYIMPTPTRHMCAESLGL